MELELIGKIADRADKMGILKFDKTSLMMDLQVANEQFNLRLEELLKADDFNFAHDVIGIQNNIDRNNLKMEGIFVPRFAEI